jgi:hypothetical protein
MIDPYAGRTVDLLVFHGVRATGETQLSQTLADDQGGEICTGIEKLVQRFLILLCTRRGSVKFHPDEGTDFLTEVSNGSVRDVTDLFATFAFAVGLIRRQFRATQQASDQLDEQFQKAILNSASISGGQVRMQITLTSNAGTARQVILPVRTVAL